MSFWDRLTGKVVEAAGLGQKKRAAATGITAFDGPVSDVRLEIAIKSHPWLQGSAVTTLLLSVWASQALQDMAAILESTAQKRIGQAGMLPEATFALADQMYDAALQWIDLAQAALPSIGSDADYVVPVRLPSPPPRLDWVADAPPAHFVAAIAAAVQLGTSAEDALNRAQDDRSRLPAKYNAAFDTIAGSIRLARAKLDQVEAAESDRQAVRLSRDIWTMLQDVIRIYFLAGQQATSPALIDARFDAAARAKARAQRLPPPPVQRQSQPRTASPPPGSGSPGAAQSPGRSPVHVGPGSAPRTMSERTPAPPPPPPPPPPTLGERLGLGFDAWELTERAAKATYQNDRTRIAELEAFWRSDTNPQETHRLFGLIMTAAAAGLVTARPGEFSRASPWIATFVALKDATIGGEQFKTGQLFTLKVGLENGLFGREFDRLGFLPGSQLPKPRPQSAGPQSSPSDASGAGPARIDTRHRGERKPRENKNGGQDGADIWFMTAAFQRPQRRASVADTEQLMRLWRADPDPAATRAAHDELLAAAQAGEVRPNGDEALRECPWSQVYIAVRPVTIGGVQLRVNEKFALQVGMIGGRFRRTVGRLGLVRSGS